MESLLFKQMQGLLKYAMVCLEMGLIDSKIGNPYDLIIRGASPSQNPGLFGHLTKSTNNTPSDIFSINTQ